MRNGWYFVSLGMELFCYEMRANWRISGGNEWKINKDLLYSMGFSGGSDGKESACNVGDLGSIPGLGRPTHIYQEKLISLSASNRPNWCQNKPRPFPVIDTDVDWQPNSGLFILHRVIEKTEWLLLITHLVWGRPTINASYYCYDYRPRSSRKTEVMFREREQRRVV